MTKSEFIQRIILTWARSGLKMFSVAQQAEKLADEMEEIDGFKWDTTDEQEDSNG